MKSFKREIKKVSSLKRAVQFVWESAPRWTIISALVLFFQGVLPILSLYMMKLMLDAVSTAIESPSENRMQAVMVTIAIAGGVYLFSYFFGTIAGLVTQIQSRVVVDHLNDVLHAKSSAVDLEYYENAKYYDTLHRAQGEASYRPVMIVNGLMKVVQNSISLLGVAWLLFSFHWSIALILLAAVLPGIVVRLVFSNQMFELQRKFTPEERRSWYFHWMLTSIEFAKEIRIFNLGKVFIDRYQDLRKKLRKERQDVDLRRAGYELIAQTIAALAVFGSYAFIAYRTIQGLNTLGDLVMYYQAFQKGQSFLIALLGGIAGLYENNLFLTNFYEFLDLKPKVLEPEKPVLVSGDLQKGIAFEHVRFVYPNGTREVIQDVSLEIRPGEIVALVGENGAGKTTLVKLLCRLYDPDSGRITLDGIDLKNLELENLRKEISVIFQDYAHYNLTARENIWLGKVGLSKVDQKILEAARKAGVHEVIAGLPNGYDTVLGKLFENGEELSIGEWQKIALARAFVRESQVIVLDEPTSAMDPKAEYEVFKKFHELLKGKTAILISHRLSTVKMADRIYVLQDGRIAEQGTHDELLYRHGIYSDLFEKQAQRYR